MQESEQDIVEDKTLSRGVFIFGTILLLPIALFFYYQPVILLENTAHIPLEANVEETHVLSPSDEIHLVFVGDIMLSRVIGKIMEEKNDWCFPFSQTADFLKGADITFGNLESPISNQGKDMGSIYPFRADPRSVESLSCAGFDVVSLANNHAWDYGPLAFLDTVNLLKGANINPIGGGENYVDAHTPVVKNIRGTKIAFLGYTNLLPKSITEKNSHPAIAYAEAGQIATDVHEAKKIADIVIVSFHFGIEYETVQNKEQEALAHSAIDAGATLVIGHHPHVVEGVEAYNKGYIFYSLGNFVFDQKFSDETKEGLLVQVTLQDKKIEKIQKIPVTFNSLYQPMLKPGTMQ